MGFRKFVDRAHHAWEVRPRSRSEWEMIPVEGNPERQRAVTAPGYESDPYELSQEELQRLLDVSQAAPHRSKPNPFKD